MKKTGLLIMLCFAATFLQAQTLRDKINEAKSYIDSVIQNNNTRNITPQKMNVALNKIIVALKYADSLGVTSSDSSAYINLVSPSANTLLICKRNGLCDTLLHFNTLYDSTIMATAAQLQALQDYVDTQLASLPTGGGNGFKVLLSGTTPTDTTVLWANSSINILDCFPIRYYMQGAWSALDTISGMFYDSVAHSISFGRPLTIAVTGQSNVIGPPDPSYTYYGDTIPTPLVCAWNYGSSKWQIAKIHQDPFASTNGANYVLVAAKKISRHFARSVRVTLYSAPGTALNCWSGNMGERPDTSACYQAFIARLNASKIKKPDLFIWGQGEAGANGLGADYYTMWVRMLDSLRKQGYMDSTKTITLWMGTADPSGQSINAPSSGGDRGGRRIGNDDDITTIYVPSRGAQQVDPHFTPLGHEQMGERAYTTFMAGVLDPRKQLLGYNIVSAFKNTDDSARLAAEGLYFTNAAGKPFIKLFSNDVRYCDANATNIAGLRLQRFSTSVTLTDYNGGTINLPGDNKMYWTGTSGIESNRITAKTGADPKFILNDAITGLSWNITNFSTTNLFRLDYNGTTRMAITSAGAVGFNTSSPASGAAFDITSTTGGFAPPRMTSTQRDAIASPSAGIQIYCTDCTATDASTGVTQTYNGSTWKNHW